MALAARTGAATRQDYDWHKCEKELNARPDLSTEIAFPDPGAQAYCFTFG